VRFWDSSAIVPLLLMEPHTPEALHILSEDPALTVWWGTSLESHAAIWAAVRRGRVEPVDAMSAENRLGELRRLWSEIQPDDEIRNEVERLLRLHDIRTGDALQLAAAWTARRQSRGNVPFVCFDRRLRQAAFIEGFKLIPEHMP
jgi:predicted nucleic acid-binding protein